MLLHPALHQDKQHGSFHPAPRTALQSLLGQVDLAFLGSYAIGMFFAGHLGDRLDLRWFLSAGECVWCGDVCLHVFQVCHQERNEQ
jgi:OPA family glycerol-3-phosphate transporter-like MFS transporter 1/2